MFIVGLIVTFLIIYLSIQIYNKKSVIRNEEPTTIISKDIHGYTSIDKFYEQKIQNKSRTINSIGSTVYCFKDYSLCTITKALQENSKNIAIVYLNNENVEEIKKEIYSKYHKLEQERIFVINNQSMLRCLKMTFSTDNFHWIES